ncbi:SSI family serine proteinase inhibitor [Streptomyces sp. NPDC020965]|uniref:SSI family serine proteinase inhibitor n=1 Tax=Streptomyces sp. NPDC020965 TaxID=3365105 RepID=UPI0037AF37BC
MPNRIALAATASLAVLATAVPVAGAVELPFPLTPLLSVAEGPAQNAARSEADRLTVIVSETGNTRTDGRYQLECAPTGGTHPSAEAACDRLDALAREGVNPFAPVPEGQMCTQQYGGSATARVTGTWHGRAVDATFTRADGCEISRWQTMEPVLPSTRS